ncbi:dihydrodipicolinate synthase family protein [Kribbella antibiotica]|uniref:Dihydrodipicolinate synthase family protein n=1 Tax=Kribbella antibiotica TaxID=190195 RepID=A0A4R4ZJD1_9ACTN|nr:dihydrodipicolinate synthase family protein [Kribbella antibiotica]TDD58851.1 dihydrodipicolinate synthase family protein [Kribbella antibiotica]
MRPQTAAALHEGVLIPAHPLALTEDGKLDESRQRALSRYYLAAGAGGLAVGVHTTQFGIRDAGLLEPVLTLAAEEVKRHDRTTVLVAGVESAQEADLARGLGYDLAMVIPRGLDATALHERVAEVGEVMPVFGFYLQPDVGGAYLGPDFWARLAELPSLSAIKIAPFSRYFTQDVVRAVCESSRADEIALYTGNDDNILLDLMTPFEFAGRTKRIVGALIGQAAVWTRPTVALVELAKRGPVSAELLLTAAQLTDANAALFDAANRFAGSVPGLHEILRRQGLLANLTMLDPDEQLSAGQLAEIDRVTAAYPALQDDDFVASHLEEWLGPNPSSHNETEYR